MPKTDEKLADILAEMRKAVVPMICGRPKIEAVSIGDVLQWADRIERAAEREREKAKDLSKELDGNRAITGNSAAMREALKYARKVLALNGFAEPVVRCDAALAAPPRACDVLAKEQLANDIIKAIDEGVPGWAKVSELEKSLAYAVVNATVNTAYSTNIVKTDEPNDEQHGAAPAPDGAERGADGDTK